jgi:tetratricopeptide (TPR) repeat protein
MIASYEADDLEACVESGSKAVKLVPGDAGVHSLLGLCFAELGRTEEALADIKEAERLGPYTVYTFGRIADAYVALDRPEEALATARRAVEFEPDSFDAHVWLGDLRLREGDIEGAQTAHEEGLVLARDLVARDPENPDWAHKLSVSLERIGDIRSEAGDTEGAQAAYEEMLAIDRDLVARDPENPDWAHKLSVSVERIGDIRSEAGDTEGAQAAYEEMLAIARETVRTDPENADGHFGLVVALLATGATDEAIDAFRASQAAGAEDTAGLANYLAWELYLRDEHAKALPIIEEWLAAHPEPTGSDYHYTLDTAAHVMAAAGQADEAVDLFLEAAELGGPDWRTGYEEQLTALGYAPEPGEEGFEAALRACVVTGGACKLFPQ